LFENAGSATPGAAELGVSRGYVYWDVASRTCGKDPSCSPEDGVAAAPVGGSVAIIEEVAPAAPGIARAMKAFSVAAHLVYQRDGEPVKVVLAGTTTPISLPGATPTCSGVASDPTHVYCRDRSGALLAWSISAGGASGPATIATGLPDGRGLAVAGTDAIFSASSSNNAASIYATSLIGAGEPAHLVPLVTDIPPLMFGEVVGKGHIAWHARAVPWTTAGAAGAHDEIWVRPLAGGPPRMIASGDARLEVALAPTDDVAFVADTGTHPPTIWRIDLATDERRPLVVPLSARSSLMRIAADAAYVYWSAVDGRIRRTRND
jgi:hypothetical protein